MSEKPLEHINRLISELHDDKKEMVSDGYHTFKELYEHRIVLFKELCHVMMQRAAWEDDLSTQPWNYDYLPWKSHIHSDGSIWEGWFIAGIGKLPGNQITYHLPDEEWQSFDVPELDKAPEYDGHTPQDVLQRLREGV